MSLSFNEKDYNVVKIKKQLSQLSKYRLNHLYRVYGLKQEGNPKVLVEFSPNLFNKEKLAPVVKFLVEDKKIETNVTTIDDSKPNYVYIGLRHDLRKNVKICTAIVKTLVHFIEGKLKGL